MRTMLDLSVPGIVQAVRSEIGNFVSRVSSKGIGCWETRSLFHRSVPRESHYEPVKRYRFMQMDAEK